MAGAMSEGVPGAARYAAGRFAPGLRVATHNVRGLTSSQQLQLLVDHWNHQRYQVVCLQETWVGRPGGKSQSWVELGLEQAAASTCCSYTAFWANNSAHGPDSGRGGTAILIRTDLLRTGQLQRVGRPLVSTDGRLLAMRLKWAGHTFTVANTYWPSTPALQREFIDRTLVPQLQQVPAGSLWMTGDFNHTGDAARDRTALDSGGTNSRRVAEEAVARYLQLQLGVKHQWVDAFRVRHPSLKGFTRADNQSAARLDRFYIPAPTTSHLQQCQVQHCPTSDHLPLLLHLRPATPLQPRGRGMPKVRMLCLASPALRLQLETWARQQVLHSSSLSAEQLLDWWPAFKAAYVAQVRSLDGAFAAERQHLTLQAQQARNASRSAWAALQHASAEATPAALQQAVLCRTQHLQAAHALVAPAVAASRDGWLAAGERPTRLLTSMVHSRGAEASGVGAVHAAGGGLITDNAGIAAAAATHFANVSAAPTCSPDAQQQILTAMSEQQRKGTARHITPQAAQRAGAARISAGEVAKALRGSNPSSASGPDGLPYTAWQLGDGIFFSLLAALFSAIHTCGRVPAGFLHGRLTIIFKKGDAADLSNYRPITVLDTVYRILGRVLAVRFGAAMGASVGREQGAFLKGRSIGDNIHLLQLLPHALLSHGISGGVAFLDIQKAYDTISRPFLLRLMSAHGADGNMLHWVSLLLSDTTAVAVVNGAVSPPATWAAGVRQGCPLSPYLYLFVAEALACWLREQPSTTLGIEVPGVGRIVSIHFADDTQVLLPNLLQATVEALLLAMRVFGAATGQHVSAPKSVLLAVGALPTPSPPPPSAPPVLAGMAVVQHVTFLGVTLSNPSLPPPSSSDTPAHTPNRGSQQLPASRQQQPAGCVCVQACELSPAGSGPAQVPQQPRQPQQLQVGMEAEGMQIDSPSPLSNPPLPSQHASHTQPPSLSPSTSDPWEARQQAVATTCNRLGSLPLSAMGRGLAVTAYALSKVLYHAEFEGMPQSSQQFLLRISAALVDRGVIPAVSQRGAFHHMPGIHSRLLSGPPRFGGFGLLPLQAHVLARHAVWASRLLLALCASPQLGTPPLGTSTLPAWIPLAAAMLRHICPSLHPSQTLLAATLSPSPSLMAAGRMPHLPNLQPAGLPPLPAERYPVPAGVLRNMMVALQALGPMQDVSTRCPQLSVEAVRLQQLQPLPTPQAVALVTRLGWQPCSAAHPRPPPMRPAAKLLSVRGTTRFLQSASEQERQTRHRQFVQEALPAGQPTAPALAAFQSTLSSLWDSPWPHPHKEILWRLAVNGISGAGGHDICLSGPCPCGFVLTPEQRAAGMATLHRSHAFWGCPVAQTVVQQLQQGVGDVPVLQHHVWLLLPPSRAVQRVVWQLVCLAALAAMDAGRRALWHSFKTAQRGDTPAAALGPDTALVHAAANHAVTSFWLTLTEFAGRGAPPTTGWQYVQADHPFLGVERPPSVPAPQLRVRLPPGLLLQPETELLDILTDEDFS